MKAILKFFLHFTPSTTCLSDHIMLQGKLGWLVHVLNYPLKCHLLSLECVCMKSELLRKQKQENTEFHTALATWQELVTAKTTWRYGGEGS